MPSTSPRPPPAPVHPLFAQPSPSPPPHDDAHAFSTSPGWPFQPSPYSHEEQAPSSPSSSSPFSLRSHQLREARVALDGLAGAGAAPGGPQGGPGGREGARTPYFEAEGETLFGPSPGTGSAGFALPSPYSLSPSSPSLPPPAASPPKYPAKGATSPEERRRLREKYALGREEEEKLGRLLGAVYAARGAVGGAAEGGGTRGGGRAPPGRVDTASLLPLSPRGPSALPPNLNGVSLPDSPPSTTSSRRSRRREYPATIETVLATAAEDGQRQLPKSPRVVELSPPPPIEEGESRSGSERFFTPPEDVPGQAYDSPRSPHPLATSHFPPPSSSADATPTRSPRTAPDRSHHLWASTTPLDSPRPLPTSRPVSPPSGASSPSHSRSRPSSLHRAFYPSDYPFPSASSSPVVSPPTSPPAERSLTPFPPLPPGSSLPDPSFVRPSTHRTLPSTGDYLPSRSGVRVYNHRPQVDGALSREEEEWVERMRRVPNDGMLRDWWGYPVGMRSGWGRAVLSPIATETEPTHSSPSYSHIHSPSHTHARSHSASSPHSLLLRSPPDPDRRYQSFAAPSSPLRQVLHSEPVSAFSSSPSALSSVALNSPPRRLRSIGVEAYDPPSRAPLANGVARAFPDEAAYPGSGSGRYFRKEHVREEEYGDEGDDDGLDALSTVASHRAPFHNTPYSASLAEPVSTARATKASSPSLHSLRPVVADAARKREEESDSPSTYSQATPLERSGVLPGSASGPSPTARRYGDAPDTSTSRRREGGEGETRSARSSPTKRTASASGSSRTEAISEWARGVSPGAVEVEVGVGTREGGGRAGDEGWEGRPSPPPTGSRSPLPPRRDGAMSRTTTTTTLPRGVEAYSDAVGMSPRPASRSTRRDEWVEGREERLATPSPPSLPSGAMPVHDSGVGLSSGRRRREEEHPAAPTSAFSPSPSALPPPSTAFPAADAWGAPASPPRDLAGPREEVERSPPSGRSPEDVAAWAREAGRGGAEEPAMEQWREREETRRSPPSKAGTAAAVAAGVAAGAFSPSPRSPARLARRAGGPDLGGAGGLSIDAVLASTASPTRSPSPPQHAYAPFSPPPHSPFAAHDPLSLSHSPHPAHDPLTPPSRFASLHDPHLAEQDELAARLRAAHSSAASEDLAQAPWPDGGYFPPSGAGADDNLYSPPRRAFPFPPQRPPHNRVVQTQLSEEEKRRRRELRKLGRSPEFGLEHEETKAGRRKRAWGEWQAFDKEKNRLLGLLTYSGPADVPVYNALAELHLNAPAQASRDLDEEFWISSLRLEEAQPDVAHQLAELLELRDPFEALHWHRVALHYDPSNPEHHLALARCLSLTGSLDAALDAYSTLSRGFTGTPYEALALFQLGRLYQDYGDGRSEEKAAAKEAYQSALAVVGRLRLVEPERRTGGRWDEVDELERALVARLAELGGEEDGASPASVRRTPHGEATPATLRRNPSSSFSTSPRFDQPRSPSAPPSLGLGLGGVLRASTMSTGMTPTTPYGGVAGQAGPTVPPRPPKPDERPRSASTVAAPARPRRSSRKTSRHLGSTFDLILSSLHRMASSPLPADLARTSQELAQQVEETYRSLETLSAVEREKEKELLRAFEELRGELEKLPEKLVATATLSAARPVHVPAPPPSPQPANLLQEALDKLERARQLTDRPSAVAVEA